MARINSPAVSGPNAGPVLMPQDIRNAQRFMVQMRNWLVRTYPDLAMPTIATMAGRSGDARRGVVASSNHDQRVISLYDPMLAYKMNSLGSGQPYRGEESMYPIQTGLHELMHQAGPRYGDSRWDRFWEEGFSEAVAADISPAYARTMKYEPQPARRFEDGSWSTPDNDFRFEPNTYGPNVAAVRKLSFNEALRQMAAGWEGLEDPGASPEAMDFRRALLAMSNKQRNRTIAKTQKRLRQELEKPGYLPRTVQSVGRVASAAARIPRDPVAVAAQQVGRSARTVARGLPSDVKRRVNAYRGGF